MFQEKEDKSYKASRGSGSSTTFVSQSESQVQPTVKGWENKLHLLIGKLQNRVAVFFSLL